MLRLVVILKEMGEVIPSSLKYTETPVGEARRRDPAGAQATRRARVLPHGKRSVFRLRIYRQQPIQNRIK